MHETRDTDNPFYSLTTEENPIDQTPVFVVGFPRSGTTLLQSLVATQGFITFPETHFFGVLLPQLERQENLIVSSTEKIYQVLETKIALSNKVKAFIARMNRGGIDIKLLFEAVIMDNLLKQSHSDNLQNIRWLEKTPGHAPYMEEISSLYPNAKFIFIMRNPLHAFSSWRNVSSGWGDNRVPVEKHCDLWRYYLKSAETFQKNHPSSVLFVKLEELVDNTTVAMHKITAFLEIDFHPENLQKRDEVVNQIILPSEVWKKDVNRPIDKSISERKNKNNLTPFESYRIANNLAGLLNTYHYTIDGSYQKNDSSSLISLMEDIKYYKNLHNSDKEIETLIKHYHEWIKKDQNICQKQNDLLREIKDAMKEVKQYRFSRHPLKKIKALSKLMSLYSTL